MTLFIDVIDKYRKRKVQFGIVIIYYQKTGWVFCSLLESVEHVYYQKYQS